MNSTKKIRIGKDIAIRWYITLPEESAETLSQMDLTLFMKDPRGNKVKIDDYTINGNSIEIGLKGTAFGYVGCYTLTLWKNKGNDGQYVAKSFNPSDVYRAGTELLQECKASELCDPQYKVDITNHGYPYGPSAITHVANIGNTGYIEVDIPSVNKTPGTLLDNTLRIVARWNPANDSTAVTETSLDRKLITLKAKSALNSIDDIWGFTGSFDVDMSWTLIEIPLSGNFRTVRIYGEDANIEIAYVSVLSR